MKQHQQQHIRTCIKCNEEKSTIIVIVHLDKKGFDFLCCSVYFADLVPRCQTTCSAMTQSCRDTEPVSLAHGTPVFMGLLCSWDSCVHGTPVFMGLLCSWDSCVHGTPVFVPKPPLEGLWDGIS